MGKRKPKTDIKALKAEYRKLAQRADKRLYRLEVLHDKDEKFKAVTDYAYARAQRDIKTWGGNKRFNTKPPETVQGLKAKIADIQHFLDSKTSTKTGIINMYKERQKTIKEQTGLDMSWEEAQKFYQEKINEKFDSQFGYRTSKIAMAVIQKNRDQIKAEFEAGMKTSYTSDKALNKVIDNMLSSYSKDLKLIGVL